LGSVYQQLGDFEQAKEFQHRALNIYLKKLGPDHIHVAATYSKLGSVYQQLSDFEQASNIRRKTLKPAHVDALNNLENMVTAEQASVALPPFS